MHLRWSLAIASFVSSALVVAIPIPGGPKESSDKYRENAKSAEYGFQATPGRSNVQRFHEQGHRTPRPGEDADHLLEVQTLHHALNAQGAPFHTLPTHHQSGIRQIINQPSNMAFIDRSLNRGKGQVVRHGHGGHQLSTHNPARDAYTRATIPNAQHTAHQLDHYLVQNGYRGNVAQTHANTMHGAGMVTPGRSMPQNTPAGGHGHGHGGLTHQMGHLNLGHHGPSTPTPQGHSHHAGGAPHTPPRTGGSSHSHLGSHAPTHNSHGLHHHDSGTPSRHGPPSTPAHQTGPHPDLHHLGSHAPARHAAGPHPGLRRSNSLPASHPSDHSMIAPHGHHTSTPHGAHHETHHNQHSPPPSPSHGRGRKK